MSEPIKLEIDYLYKKLAMYLANYFGVTNEFKKMDFTDFPSAPTISINYQIQGKNTDGKNITLIPHAEALFRMGPIHGNEIIPYNLFQAIRDFDRNNNDDHLLERKLVDYTIIMICEEMNEYYNELGPDFCVSINVNPRLFDDRFVNRYLDIISRYPKISPKNIGVELVESSRYPIFSQLRGKKYDEQINVISKIENFTNNINRLKDKGCMVSIDDFNTGFATEEVLETYPFDAVKLDRGLTKMLNKELHYIDSHSQLPVDEVRKQLSATVLATVLYSFKTKEKEEKPIPSRIVIEGFEKECEKLPLLIEKYYGKYLNHYGIGTNERIYQGYAISKPVQIKNMAKLYKKQLELDKKKKV